MILKVDRFAETANSTLGKFSINGKNKCYTLEDDYDLIKVQGETRIPAGVYRLDLRYKGGFYERYSERFNEAHPMLWLRNVPNYKYVLIHPLNFHTETEGCIGVGKSFDVDQNGDYFLKNSTKAYLKLYYPIREALVTGETVRIFVQDFIGLKPIKAEIPDAKIRKAIKQSNVKVTVSMLEKMSLDFDSKAAVMGSINFVTARLTGYKWFKEKIKVKRDQSPLGRLIELLVEFLTKLKGKTP